MRPDRETVRQLLRVDARRRGTRTWSHLARPLIQPALLWLVSAPLFAPGLEAAGVAQVGLFVAAGVFPWFALSQSLGRSSGLLVEYATFARRGAAPLTLLAALPALEATLTLAAALVALTLLSIASGTAGPRLLLLPLLLAAQGLLALGLGWVLSAVGALHRATADAVPLALYLLLLTAPVLHTGSGVPSPWRDLVGLNPLTPLIHGYRFALGCGAEPSGFGVLGLATATATALLVGAGCLRRLRPWASELL